MSWLELPYADEAEEIDDPQRPYAETARSMGDVARANRLFWGTRPVLHHVARLLQGAAPGSAIRILDIATGSADIPRALLEWGRRRGLKMTVVGVDNMPAMLRMAREDGTRMPLIQADAFRLPFAPGSFDIVLCALAFHHFGFDLSVSVLRTMDRLTTRGFVVSDLRRDRLALAVVRTGMGMIGSQPSTRHDARASVHRAFTPREYAQMIALSGAQHVRIHSHGYVRMALVQNKNGKPREWVTLAQISPIR